MPPRRRGEKFARPDDDDLEEGAAAAAGPADVDGEDDVMEEVEEEEEEGEEAEEQEGFFDVNMMEEKDSDQVFHLLNKGGWVPGEWCIDLDDICNLMSESPLTSVVKVPDMDKEQGRPDANGVLELGEDDADDIWACISMFDIGRNLGHPSIQGLLKSLRAQGRTDEPGKPDLRDWLEPAALQQHPVALVVSERLVNLPAELGAQLQVNMFEELARQKGPQPEFVLILSRVVLNANTEGGEAEEGAAAAAGVGKRARKRARKERAQEQPAVSEETSFFYRQEERFYLRHRHALCGLKHFVYTAPGKAAGAQGGANAQQKALVPLLVHRSALPRLLKDIKSLDSYFGDQGQ